MNSPIRKITTFGIFIFIMWGNLVNVAAIISGGFIGTFFNRSLPQRYQAVVFQGIGLFVMVLGVSMAIKMEHILVSVFSLLLGGLTGELIRLDEQINKLGEWFKRNLKLKSERFTDGFVSASLIYCVGAMSVLGAIEEGTGGFPSILLTKSVMDGFCSIVFASALGIGVVFSAVPVAVYQGTITLIAFLLAEAIDMSTVNELSAVGGILLVGLGIDLLEIKHIKVMNLLPALIFVVVLMQLFTP